jgi:hypothetical protein
MGTPVYGLRLPKKVQDDLVVFAKIYGAVNGRAFAREVLEVMTSGDLEKVKQFNARLIRGVGEQLTLKLNATMDDAINAAKPAAIATVTPTGGKERRKRAKRAKR